MSLTAAQVAQYGATIKQNITNITRAFVVLMLLAPAVAQAQSLSLVQRTALKAVVMTGATAQSCVDGDLQGVADQMNTEASPAFWVWRTNVSRSMVYTLTDNEGGTFNWTTYKNQGATEQNAWVQMFMGDEADFSQDNLRAGVAAIFTGSAAATAQRDHILSIGRGKATRFQKVFATGTGSTGAPAKFGVDALGAVLNGTAPYTVFGVGVCIP